ncbi:MAG: hypothetical protein FWD34_01280 [Oscillospiraceae bacterium]|nr:hypothetical protein [Oscillospiraceae bacterium]
MLKRLLEKRGEFSVKGLAIMVGTIVVIGAVVTIVVNGLLEGWIVQVWDTIWGWIESTFMS